MKIAIIGDAGTIGALPYLMSERKGFNHRH